MAGSGRKKRLPPPPKAKEPVVMRRFGQTGDPVAIPKRVNDIARREGLRLEEDGGLSERQPPRRRRRTDRPQPKARKDMFVASVRLDPSAVRDLRGQRPPKPPRPTPGPPPTRR